MSVSLVPDSIARRESLLPTACLTLVKQLSLDNMFRFMIFCVCVYVCMYACVPHCACEGRRTISGGPFSYHMGCRD